MTIPLEKAEEEEITAEKFLKSSDSIAVGIKGRRSFFLFLKKSGTFLKKDSSIGAFRILFSSSGQ